MFFNDTTQIIDKFIGNDKDKASDYLKNENSNFVYSLPLMRKNISNFAEEKYLMEKVLPKKLVDLYEEGIVYIHDKQLSSYCLSVSCKDVATKGIPTNAKNMIASKPTKRIKKLLRHFSNVVVLMSQQVSGAVMLSQMTTILASYLHYEETEIHKKINDEDLQEEIQSLIWELNMPLRSGSESAFSNISLEFGKPSEEIKNEYVVIGGEMQLYKYCDIPEKYFDRINKAIIDVMAQGTGTGIPFTFPLITVPIDDNFNFNNKMFLYLLDKMYRWGGCYFENFRTEPFKDEYYTQLNPNIKPRDPEVSRSLCPLDGNQEVLYFSDKLRKFVSSPIKDLYYNIKKSKDKTKKIISNGKIIEASVNQFKINNFAEITLMNGLKIKTTLNHLNKTLRSNEILTSDLTTNDYLPISRKVLQGKGLTYDEGVLVGAFLGDGSFDSNNDNVLSYSLHKETDKKLIEWIQKIVTEKFGGYTTITPCTSHISGEQNCLNVRVTSKYLIGLIKQYTKGNDALTKEIDLLALSMSEEFRRGIIHGFYETDGGNNNRFYTSSLNLVKSFTTLCASLGIPVRIDEDNRDTRLGNNVNYIIRMYIPDKNKSQYENVYKLDDNYFWFKIKDIKYYNKDIDAKAYCFEVVNNNEPYFMLSNGIITHNCRLQIDLSLLKKVGSGIFGSSTGSTGAVQVLNLNMNRVMIEFGQNKKLMKQKIKEYFEIMEEGHIAKRNWIENHKELYPTLFAFNENLKNYFNVFAVSGMHEGLINLGYKDGMKDKEGKKFAHEIMQYITSIVDEIIERDKIACGVEYAPNENAGIKLARNDVRWAKKHNREIFVQGNGDDVFLTAGCMLPFSETNFFEQIENSAEFQAYATSGSILHHFVESKVEPQILAKYIDKLFQKPINYITLTPTITSCMSCGQTIVAQDGKYIEKCPICESDDIATFSRVIGYVKPIARKKIHITLKGKYEGIYNFWSSARRIDWNQRKRFKIDTLNDVIDNNNK